MAEFDYLDCFNDDLVWIMDRLVSRSGGRFGLMTRYVRGEKPVVLAMTTEMPQVSESFVHELVQQAASTSCSQRRRNDDDVSIREERWSSASDQDSRIELRILQLRFVPTQNVTLVASVCRLDGSAPYSQFEVLTASKLYPVLSRYFRLWWLHRMERRRANSLSAALDLSDVGVMLLDLRGNLLFANARAMSILEHQDGLRRDDSYIVATDAPSDIPWQTAIQRALHLNRSGTSEQESKAPLDVPLLVLQRSSERRALLATAVNVRHAAVDDRDPAAIIYVFDPEHGSEQMLQPVFRIYKLTVSEARLVQHLMNGLRITEAAAHMQIQPDTVRAYLKQVFVKTGTNRQVDLVRLMFTSMLRTNPEARAHVDQALSPFD